MYAGMTYPNRFYIPPRVERFCAGCHNWRPAKSGKEIKFRRGNYYRWFCEFCAAKAVMK